MKITELKYDIPNFSKIYKITDFEYFFDIYNVNSIYRFNLNNSIYFDVNQDSFLYYTLTTDMHWPLISYKIYGTPRLAWLLMKINNVTAKNVFKKIPAATTLKYLDTDLVQKIINTYISNG